MAALALVAGYVFVSAAFTLPPSRAQDAVNEAFAPYFSQKWDVFAPKILRVNSALEVQAQWRDENDELVHSEWIGVTETELSAVAGAPMPSRIAKNTVNAAVAYVGRYEELTSAQQERVQDTFIQVADEGEFAPIPDAELIAEVEELGGDEAAVISFIRYDYMLTRFSATFAEAHYGEEIERVRWRIRFDRPNDFAHRFDSETQTPQSLLTFGWRQPAEDPAPDAVEVFRDVENRYDE